MGAEDAEDAEAACSDVFPLNVLVVDVLHDELHRLSLLGVVDSGVSDFLTVMITEEVVVIVEVVIAAGTLLTAKMG